jgi:hypothetical protein
MALGGRAVGLLPMLMLMLCARCGPLVFREEKLGALCARVIRGGHGVALCLVTGEDLVVIAALGGEGGGGVTGPKGCARVQIAQRRRRAHRAEDQPSQSQRSAACVTAGQLP